MILAFPGKITTLFHKGAALYLNTEIREIEQRVDTAGLMEKAGLAVATLARELVAESSDPVLILVGPGNNGGDALVAARLLKQWGYQVVVVMPGDVRKFPQDAQQAYQTWLHADGRIETTIPQKHYALVLDGLFGIGLQRPLAGEFYALIKQVNALPAAKLAIDIPSGLCSNTGRVLGIAVEAAHTLTFIARKPGLFTLDGPDYAGTVHLADLGIIANDWLTPHGHLLEQSLFMPALPARKGNSHKGTFGSVAIIGGANGTVGAVLRGACRLVKWCRTGLCQSAGRKCTSRRFVAAGNHAVLTR